MGSVRSFSGFVRNIHCLCNHGHLLLDQELSRFNRVPASVMWQTDRQTGGQNSAMMTRYEHVKFSARGTEHNITVPSDVTLRTLISFFLYNLHINAEIFWFQTVVNLKMFDSKAKISNSWLMSTAKIFGYINKNLHSSLKCPQNECVHIIH